MIKLLHLFKTGMLTGISLAIILQSCTIEKRHYRPGYNIEFKNKSSKKLSNPIEPEQMKVDDNSTTEASINNSPENNALAISSGLATAPNQIPDFNIAPKKNVPDGDGCDRIYLLNGKIIKSRISHHKDSVIRYVNCDSVGGKEFTINKRQIKAIKYANGKYIVLNNVKYENDEKFFQEDPDKIVNEEEIKAKNKEEELESKKREEELEAKKREEELEAKKREKSVDAPSHKKKSEKDKIKALNSVAFSLLALLIFSISFVLALGGSVVAIAVGWSLALILLIFSFIFSFQSKSIAAGVLAFLISGAMIAFIIIQFGF
jgi:hypothetical protein